MKVRLLSTYDAVGGAARATRRLHEGLRAAGIESGLLVRHLGNPGPGVDYFRAGPGLLGRLQRRRRSWLQQRFRHRTAGIRDFTPLRGPFGAELLGSLAEDEIIHLHWIADFVDLADFLPAAVRRHRVVWTCHDMRMFTGGCHFSGNCTRHQHGCGACPLLRSSNRHDVSHQQWTQLQEVVASLPPERLCIVAPSNWMAELARQHQAFRRFAIETIPYGVDLTTFRPQPQEFCREVLKLPVGSRIVLFIAESVADPRKGWDLLLAAMEALGRIDDVLLVSLGQHAPSVPAHLPHRHFAHHTDERWVSLLLNAADVFALPSRADNLPQTAIEAIACGRPVVGFDVGGVGDIVVPDRSGVLLPLENSAEFGPHLAQLLGDPARMRRLGASARQHAEAQFRIEQSVERQIALYSRLS